MTQSSSGMGLNSTRIPSDKLNLRNSPDCPELLVNASLQCKSGEDIQSGDLL